jgi:co-chaperonin GroES (HSP10)
MNLRLLNANVLIDPIVEEKIGSIFLPDEAKHLNSHYGTVVAIGQGTWSKDKKILHPMRVKVGDVVFYRLGAEMEVEGKKYVLCDECQLVGVREGI